MSNILEHFISIITYCLVNVYLESYKEKIFLLILILKFHININENNPFGSIQEEMNIVTVYELNDIKMYYIKPSFSAIKVRN